MIEWHSITEKPPIGETLLAWYERAGDPVLAVAYTYQGEGWNLSSSMARGVTWTHWAKINYPESN